MHAANAAVAMLLGAFGLLLAALVTALTFDLPARDPDELWKLKLKIAALNGYGFTGGGGFIAAVLLLVALGLVNGGGGNRRGHAIFVGVAVCLACLWVGIATIADTLVTVTSENQQLFGGHVAGAVISNLAVLVLLLAAAVWGAATTGSSG